MCKAPLNTRAFLKRSNMVTYSFTCKHAIAAIIPEPQSITALWRWCSFYRPTEGMC